MTNIEANNLIELIFSYVFQDYTKVNDFFKFLNKYKSEFPENCFYSGICYRKMEIYHENQFNTLKSCSKSIQGLQDIHPFNFTKMRIYSFICKKAFDLEEIIKYLNLTYTLKNNLINILLERVQKEQEIIAVLSKREFKKIK